MRRELKDTSKSLGQLADKIINTDVLIIGSEGAGAMAAIKASKYDVRITVVTKGVDMGRSGATITAGTDIDADAKSIREVLGLPGDPRDSKEKFFEDMVVEGKWVNNQEIVEKHVEDAPVRLKELQDWGCPFEKEIEHAPGHSYPRGVLTSGREVMRALMRKVEWLGKRIEVFGNTMVTDLLTREGRVVGAVALDLRTGEFVVFQAKSVILATGGGLNIYPYTTACTILTGDGQAMAYRVGAEIIDAQFVLFLLSTWWSPPVSVTSAPHTMLLQGSWLLNREGERFMTKWDPVRMERTTRDWECIGPAVEVAEGRGWYDRQGGWVVLSFAHLPPVITDYIKSTSWWYKEYDLLKDKAVPVFPGTHFFCGGVRINTKCETNIPGLYAAGEVAGGCHGGNRLSGNAVSQVLIQGAWAGEAAAEHALTAKALEPDEKQVEGFRDKVYEPLERKEGIDTIKMKDQVQRLAVEKVGPARRVSWLTEAIKEIERMKKEIPRLYVASKKQAFNREWQNAVEIRNMVDYLDVMARSALFRTESRGNHHLLDYPRTDNTSWLKNVIAKEVNGEISLRTEPLVMAKGKMKDLGARLIAEIRGTYISHIPKVV